jgi:hypothetical protein
VFPSRPQLASRVRGAQRNVRIDARFQNARAYQSAFERALIEDLNLQLVEVARKYYAALDALRLDSHAPLTVQHQVAFRRKQLSLYVNSQLERGYFPSNLS